MRLAAQEQVLYRREQQIDRRLPGRRPRCDFEELRVLRRAVTEGLVQR